MNKKKRKEKKDEYKSLNVLQKPLLNKNKKFV